MGEAGTRTRETRTLARDRPGQTRDRPGLDPGPTRVGPGSDPADPDLVDKLKRVVVNPLYPPERRAPHRLCSLPSGPECSSTPSTSSTSSTPSARCSVPMDLHTITGRANHRPLCQRVPVCPLVSLSFLPATARPSANHKASNIKP
ncbi:unnamed protein product [Arctogadus glacialis]